MTDVSTRIIEIVTTVLSEHHLFRPVLDITPESSLNDLGADDIDRIGIALRVETEFGFVISDAEEGGWTHLSDIIATVAQHEGASA